MTILVKEPLWDNIPINVVLLSTSLHLGFILPCRQWRRNLHFVYFLTFRIWVKKPWIKKITAYILLNMPTSIKNGIWKWCITSISLAVYELVRCHMTYPFASTLYYFFLWLKYQHLCRSYAPWIQLFISTSREITNFKSALAVSHSILNKSDTGVSIYL